MEAPLYTQAGKETKKISLPESVFGVKWNSDLVHQVVTSMMSSVRTPVAHAKNRGEVSGGGKKPWKQKGTGRARHGSTRSPIWVGGGVTHGPRNDKSYERKVNKKMKAKALYAILSAKLKKGQIIFVDELSFKAPKTKDAAGILSSLSKISGFSDLLSKKRNSAYVALSAKDASVEKSFRNLGNLEVDEIRNMSPLDLMKYKYVVIANPEAGIAQIEGKISAKVPAVKTK
jgi:large subunit ribosomal protein L4